MARDAGLTFLDESLVARMSSLGLSAADVEEQFIRGGGNGGQKINKTSSTVVLRHRPTGVEVRCQRERSQVANRALAWALLVDKIESQRAERQRELQDDRERRRRQNRPRPFAVKKKFVETKRLRARRKDRRGRVERE